MNCPTQRELSDYLLGKLAPEALEAIDAHVDHCAACQAALTTVGGGDDTLVAHLRRPLLVDSYAKEPECRAVAAWARDMAVTFCPAGEATNDWRGSDIDLPRQLGEYELLEMLGTGGMGVVYKARQTRLDKIVALKVLPQQRTLDPHAVNRFEREMKAIGRLSQPSIVQAYDAREINGTKVLVMEYIEGLDLAKVARRLGPLPIAEACEIARQAALGLQYIHEHGLVHRDIKPSNLILTCQGQVKILDLGLALLGENQPGDGEVTSSESILGTADYVAPEQVSDAHSVDIRADIYSLGCTLYRLLAGQPPFSGPQYSRANQKLTGHARDPAAPVRSKRPDVPEKLAAVLERMLAKAPGERPPTPAAIVDALKPFAAKADLRDLLRRAEAPAATDESAMATKDHVTSHQDGKLSRQRPPIPESAAHRWRPSKRFAVMAMCIAAVALGTVILIMTDRGKLQINVHDDDVQVQVLKNGKEVLIVDTKTRQSVGLRSGQYEVNLLAGKPGLTLSTSHFTMRRGEKVIVEVVLPPAPPPSGDRPSEKAADMRNPTPPPRAIAPFDAKKAKEHQETWANYLGVPVEFTNSAGMKFTLIPPGEFEMGSPKELIDEESRFDPNANWYLELLRGEGPGHHVRITRARSTWAFIRSLKRNGRT